MFDIPGVSLLLGLATLFGWLTWRAWRATHRVLKWAGAVTSALVALASVTALAAALVGYAKLNRKHGNPVREISVDVTPENVARGARFGTLCASCHATDSAPPMEGRDFLTDGAPPVGTLYAPNLTPTHLREWTDGEIIRAIREGVHRSGRSLLIMPASMFRNLSDNDVESIVAFLRSQEPVEPDRPATSLNVLGAIMVNIAPVFEAQPPITRPIVAPPEGPTAEHGAYLTSYLCTLCHGADLGGDAAFNAPGLVGAGRTWTEAQFITFIRTGVRPDGTAADSSLMPWKEMSGFLPDDDQLRAIFAHLGTLGG